MGKMELEVKVLNIDEKKIINKIKQLGGTLIEESNQFLYTYDLPTIYGRYVDIVLQLNEPENEVKKESAISKLKLLFFEIDNLLSEKNKKELFKIIGCENFSNLLEKDDILDILNKETTLDFVKQFHNNPKKWIRLRKTNDITTLTVKHILADNGSNVQQMLETEMVVPSMEEANDLLETLGYSYKNYQEKRRVSYLLNNHEIDIDTWPGIPTYMEIEGRDENDLNEVLNLLGYTIKDTVSCTADEIYKMYGKNIFNIRELKL